MIYILGITGAMGSGKTTLMNLLADKLYRHVITLKFAAPLYDIQAYIYERTRVKLLGAKDRKLLQFLGTDWGRSIDPELWVKIWHRDATELRKRCPDALIICDDVRFNNEGRTINEMGGHIIKVNADLGTRNERITILGNDHASEQGLSAEWVDRWVDNNGSLSDLDMLAGELIRSLDV